MMHRSMMVALAVAGLLVAGGARLGAQEPDPRAVEGERVFVQYCASCHGPDAKGNGPMAEELRRAPADLTTIASRRDGVFPDAQMAEVIDGRRRVRGHGPRDMPVWGRRFGQDVAASSADTHQNLAVRGQVLALVAYLRSIQQ
jgi:mono/diheme cytochrome c family protein